MNQQQAYVGYGLLANEEFVKRILGRQLKPLEGAVSLAGFQLRVIERDQLPKSVQDDTPSGFRIYGLAKTPDTRRMVSGIQLYLSGEEQAAIDELNFDRELYEPHGVSFDNGVQGRIDVLQNEQLGVPIEDGLNYEPFLNDIEGSLTVAELLHNQFIKPMHEGRPSRLESR